MTVEDFVHAMPKVELNIRLEGGMRKETLLMIAEQNEIPDAEKNFDIDPGPVREHQGCKCGSILRGVSTPLDCPLFRTSCTPEHPVGPCMVSSEGSCSTYYQYGDFHG